MSPKSEDTDSPQVKKVNLLRLQSKPSDPLIVDRWTDVAFIALWFVYGLWGVVSLIVGLPTIAQFAPDWYQPAWSGMIGVLSITAALLASLIFFETSWMQQLTKKKLERAVVRTLLAFIAIYPVLLILRSTIGGDVERTGATSVLAFSFLIFPALRIHNLGVRIKAIKGVQANATGANRVL